MKSLILLPIALLIVGCAEKREVSFKGSVQSDMQMEIEAERLRSVLNKHFVSPGVSGDGIYRKALENEHENLYK